MTRSSRSLAILVAVLFVTAGVAFSATSFVASKIKPETIGQLPQAAEPPAIKNRALLIHILGPDGKPFPGVEIHRSVWTKVPTKDPNFQGVSDDKGQLRLPVPEGLRIFRVWARAAGHVPLFAHWEEDDNPETTLPAEFTFKLERGTVIGGIVRDSEGKPIEGVTIEVQLQTDGKSMRPTSTDMWLSEKGPTTHKGSSPVTDANGKWTLDNVPPGDDVKVLLNIEHPGYISDSQWGTLQKEQGIDMKSLRAQTATITMQGGVKVEGTVTDAQGKPVANAVVVRGDQPYWEWGSQEVLTDERGVFHLPSLPAGEKRITVIAQDWMPETRKVTLAKDMKPVDFRLKPGKVLRLRFVDRAGKAVPKVAVQIDKWRGSEALYNHRHPNVVFTKIPTQSDKDGLYEWTWAPDDAVTFNFWKEGYATQKLELTADDRERIITMDGTKRISGKVSDAVTGAPVEGLIAMPVLEFRPGLLHVDRSDKKAFMGGNYAIEGDRNDLTYRVRVEAPGYRSAMSDAVASKEVSPIFDFRLEPALPTTGRVVDANGQAVEGASVFLATASQVLEVERDPNSSNPSNQKTLTDRDGRFSFPAQFERYMVVASNASGYAETTANANQQPGDLKLRAWARVEGRLSQAGQAIPAAWVVFSPIRINGAELPRVQGNFLTETDKDGHFVMTRVPPIKANLRAQLSVWRDSPLHSSRSIPLDLQPGEHAQIDLGDVEVQAIIRKPLK